MPLTFDEIDALNEISNIAAGSATCYISNISVSDVDISVPYFFDTDKQNIDFMFDGKSIGYRLLFTSFTAGYCVCVLKDHYSDFRHLLEISPDSVDSLKKTMDRVVMTAIEPIERLMEQSINIEVVKNLEDEWKEPWKDEKDSVVGVYFDVLIDGKINARMVLIYPYSIAKKVSDRFINNGVAITTV